MNNLVLRLCVFAVAGWTSRGQHQVIEYLLGRNYQGLDNDLLTPLPANTIRGGAIRCRERLGGILSRNFQDAA
jgi:hypothetical protein